MKTPHRSSGYSLAELLVAMLLLGILMLGVAPMFLASIHRNAAGADMGSVGAAAVDRLEQLRAAPIQTLDAGGSLTADATVGGTPYFDVSNPGFVVRWRITGGATPAGGLRIDVRALSTRETTGPPKEITLSSIRGTL